MIEEYLKNLNCVPTDKDLSYQDNCIIECLKDHLKVYVQKQSDKFQKEEGFALDIEKETDKAFHRILNLIILDNFRDKMIFQEVV